MLIEKIIDADALPKNGVIIVKTDNVDEDFIKSLEELGKTLKPATSGKNISVFILKKGDSIETKTPEQMALYGWHKKNKGDFTISIESGTLLTSLVKEIKAGSKGATQDLAEIIAERIVEAIAKPEFQIVLK